MASEDKLCVLICGGGRGVHTLAGLAASKKDVEVRIFTTYQDESEKWTKANKEVSVIFKDDKGKENTVKGKPAVVSKTPDFLVPGCHVIFLMTPASAHEEYLKAIQPHIEPDTVIVGLPGQCGFEFAVRTILKDKLDQLAILSFDSHPWYSEIKTYGLSVEVKATKKILKGAIFGKEIMKVGLGKEPVEAVQYLMGEQPVLDVRGHVLGVTLMAPNASLHPAIMYRKWARDEEDEEEPVDEAPLFFQDVDRLATALLSAINCEILDIARAVRKANREVDLFTVKDIFDWYLECYPDEIENKNTLTTVLKTNKAYNGIKHPMKSVDGGKFLPDYTHRYLAEDVPFGLAVVKGIADIAGVETPNIDKVIVWAQTKLGKEYMVNGKMTGKDIKSTRCPQAFGYKTVNDILGM
ncbi:octopine dehydrogenase [Lingula anatina]|uniref:Octopine dehydrogenase n=1 Tax=Lingula anatina TaxID=7574 RepID=A0A1S3JK96_LINAN|nr:octopine dehydrogenase [Lingula anatina]|eukprot:XP_013410793.1 octopine dehydrogenase [Lingula anatina]